jgi:apolipoprotein N-acyltransferase
MVAVPTTSPERVSWIHTITSRARAEAPPLVDWIAALATSLLLILSFPNSEFAPLAWISLVPLVVIIARRPSLGSAFMLGWASGTVFFYVSCHWLTYSMIHYGGLPALVAYLMLIPGALVIGLFPGIFAMALAFMIRRHGPVALLLAPFIWVAVEYARLGITGQLWNAIGYSQAYYSLLIQAASWGGVYAVGFLIVVVNSAVAFALFRRTGKAIIIGLSVLMIAIGLVIASLFVALRTERSGAPPYLDVIALQPNVPMTLVKTTEELQLLLDRHLSMSTEALRSLPQDNVPRLLVWPESPMNFAYASDRKFQELVGRFTREHRVSLLFNSQEPAPGGGTYNSAVLINEEGRMISQYDKIRLLPFGEYVPIPRWLPGASLITAIVGDFTPGANYTLMPVGNHRAGVFICVESAYPSIARALTTGGADVLINISNDGYLGPTAVMRQHLANAIFRAVENGRPVLRVTNSGITARIRKDGFMEDQTQGFQTDVRRWRISGPLSNDTFYSRHGDLFVQICSVLSVLIVAFSCFRRRRDIRRSR